MVDETLQAAFEIKTACDEISRKLLRWHWEQKPGAHSLDALLKHLAQRQKESPDYYDRMPDLSGKHQLAAAGYHPVYAGAAGPGKGRGPASGPAGQYAAPRSGPPRLQRGADGPQRSRPRLGPHRWHAQAAILFNEAVEEPGRGLCGHGPRRPASWSSITGWRRTFLSRCGAKKPLASARAEEEEPRASTRNRNGTKPRSQSRGSGSSRSGNARHTNSGRSAGRGNGSRSRGSGRKKQRRVHYSRKMAVVLVAAVVLGLVVRAVSMGLFAK